MADNDDIPTSPSPAPDRMRDLIYAQLYPDVDKSVRDGIEDEKNKVRNGDGTLWGMIKGLIFQLAEALGFDKWLAGMFGMHIPDENETKTLTAQVTASVSDVVTAKDADGKPVVAQMTAQQLHDAVSERVSYDIKNNPVLAKAFDAEHIADIAEKAGAAAAGQIDTVRSVVSPVQPAVNVTPLTGTPEQQVNQTLQSMADRILAVVPPDKQADAQALKPLIADVGTKLIMAHPELADKPDELAKQYANALQKSDAAKAGLAKLGMDITDEKTMSMLLPLLQSNLSAYSGVLAKAVQGQAAGIKAPEAAPVDYHKIITDKISDQIRDDTAQQILATYNGGGISGWYVQNGAVKQAASVLNKYNATPPANAQEENEKAIAVQTLYQRGVDLGHAPNTDQRLKIGEIVADTAIATLKNPANKNLLQGEMGNLMQSSVTDALIRNTPAIDALGTHVADMNEYYFKSNTDLVGTISGNIGDKLRNTDDPDKIYNMLKVAQASLLGPDNAVADAATKAGVANPGITGGQAASEVTTSLAFGNANRGAGGMNIGGQTRQPGAPGPAPVLNG